MESSQAIALLSAINSMDDDFLDVFKMKIIAGRNFSRDYPKDEDTSVILTESATRMLGYKKPEDAVSKTSRSMNLAGTRSLWA